MPLFDVEEDACVSSLPLLKTGARSLGISLTSAQLSVFSAYCRLLLHHNRRVNLTGIDDPVEVMRRHFLDSLTLALALHVHERQGNLSIVDIGSGAGLPGLALATAFPSWKITLIESVKKKADFLELAIDRLQIANATAVCERAEVVARSEGRDTYDLAVGRAVAATVVLLEYCAPLVRVGGRIILYKSGDIEKEIAQAQIAFRELQCKLEDVIPVPGALDVGVERKLVVATKVGPTPARFPRRPGLARSKPLT